MIKNIVFDFGGVILTEDDNWINLNETKKLLNATEEQLNNGWLSSWPDGRDGKSNEDEFFKNFLLGSINKYDPVLVQKLKEIYRAKVDTFDVLPLLSKIKNNYKLFALTNIAKDWLEYKTDKFKLNNYFELIISSCGERVAKPNREIFEVLITKGRIIPGESIFIDNMDKNILSAKVLGFNTILFENFDQLIKELDKFKVNYD